MENGTEITQKTHMIQQFHFWVQMPEYSLKPQRIESWVSKKYWCTCSSMIHIKQNVDSIYMYTNGWKNKQNWSVHTKDHYSSLKRKGILTCHSFPFSSVTQSCPTLCDSMDCSTPGFPVHHQLLELAQSYVHRVGMPSNHLILCHLHLLLPSIFPSIRVFSKESVICIRWPEHWSFSFSISPSNDYSDWFHLGWTGWISLQSKELSTVFNTTVQKYQLFSSRLSLWSNSHIHTRLLEKP